MQEVLHVGRVALLAAAALVSVVAPAPVAASDRGVAAARDPVRPSVMPHCVNGRPGRVDGSPPRWDARLDAHGRLAGYTLTLGSVAYELPRTSFFQPVSASSAVVGVRRATRTRIVILDPPRGCALWRRTLDGLVYGTLVAPGGWLYYSVVAPGDRRELGVWRVQLTGSAGARLVSPPPADRVSAAEPRSVVLRWERGRGLVATWCAGRRCLESGRSWRLVDEPDGATDSDSVPDLVSVASDPVPVPASSGPRWPAGKVLRYRWSSSEPMPAWARPAASAAAEDVDQTRASRAPVFRFDTAATETIRYAASFPSGACEQAIACASWAVPDWWTVRVRAHGYDFRWGTLRWCQLDSRDGCFDLERVVLHELGHVVGLQHPETAGLHLGAYDTVMHHVTPARPRAGSGMHRFGQCDVATLQERYGVQAGLVPISPCNDVATRTGLGVSATRVGRGDTVVFAATLEVADSDEYGRLRGMPLSDREVILRRRPIGGAGDWSVFWMSSGTSAGTYVMTMAPIQSFEYQAVFTGPSGEGLDRSFSSIIPVRVTGSCDTGTCPALTTAVR